MLSAALLGLYVAENTSSVLSTLDYLTVRTKLIVFGKAPTRMNSVCDIFWNILSPDLVLCNMKTLSLHFN
jgi:hypothetical protein